MPTNFEKATQALDRAKEIRQSNKDAAMMDYRSINKHYRAHELAKQISNRLSENKLPEKPTCLECILWNEIDSDIVVCPECAPINVETFQPEVN